MIYKNYKINNFMNSYPGNIRIHKVGLILVLVLTSLFFLGSNRIEDRKIISKNTIEEKIDISYPQVYTILNGYIYYVSLYDYKVHCRGENQSLSSLVSQDIVSEFGVIAADDWLYYISVEDEYSLYRVKVTGDSRMKISKKGVGKYYGSFLKFGGNIYYFENDGILYKINSITREMQVDDSEEIKLIFCLNPQSFIVNNILYNVKADGIYNTDINILSEKKLSNDLVYSEIKIENNWIYYINKLDMNLYRRSLDGKKKENISFALVIIEGADYDSGGFYVGEKFIYYTCINNVGKCDLWRMDKENLSKELFWKDVIQFYIRGDFIYFMDDIDEGNLYKMNIKNKEVVVLDSDSFIPYIDAQNNMIFYMIKSQTENDSVYGRLMKVNADGKEKIELK